MRLYGSIYVLMYGLLLVVLFVLPYFSFEGYSLVENSISELGAQYVPGNWLANLSIFLLSTSTMFLGTKALYNYWRQLVVIYFFCISFLLTGVFRLAGSQAETHLYNYTHDQLHSFFSTLAGFAFCSFCVLYIFILEKPKHRVQTFVVFALSMLLSFLIFKFPDYRGVFQRLLFVVNFGWLFYALVSYKRIPYQPYRSLQKKKKNIQN